MLVILSGHDAAAHSRAGANHLATARRDRPDGLLTALAWVAARLAAVRLVPWPALRLELFAIAGVLAVVVVPAYRHRTVIESFPAASTPATSAPAPPGAAPEHRAPAPGESFTEPVRTRVAPLRGIDHRAEGTVAVYRHPDGRLVVNLEDVDIQPGPDYHVFVVPGADREDPDGGNHLDNLRGDRGTQFYDVPNGIDLDDGAWTVLVWCRVFAVPVAAATSV